MTPQTLPVAFAIPDSARPPTVTPLTVVVLSTAERARRALARLGLTWAVGLACLIVPLLHFVLVPLGLLAGPVVAFLVWRRTVRVSGQGTCARCGGSVDVPDGTFGWPVVVTCLACKTVLHLTPTRDGSGGAREV
ncbi:MAG: hypothetical protein JNG84_14830 [Archangium sp.]|nr:hypothetical protein [Archangium sp.]